MKNMMINKRLIDTVKNSKKYIACNVISQWVSLAVNIIIMGLIAKMLQALSVGTVEAVSYTHLDVYKRQIWVL